MFRTTGGLPLHLAYCTPTTLSSVTRHAGLGREPIGSGGERQSPTMIIQANDWIKPGRQWGSGNSVTKLGRRIYTVQK